MQYVKIVFSILLLGLGMNGAFAQPGEREMRTAEERATNQTARLEKRLSLTAEQKEQVYAINLEAAQQNDELRAQMMDGQIERTDFREERRAVEENRDSELEALLTEEQQMEYEAMKEELRQKMMERRGNRGKGGKGKKSQEDDTEQE